MILNTPRSSIRTAALKPVSRVMPALLRPCRTDARADQTQLSFFHTELQT